jgi:hypothetical protein
MSNASNVSILSSSPSFYMRYEKVELEEYKNSGLIGCRKIVSHSELVRWKYEVGRWDFASAAAAADETSERQGGNTSTANTHICNLYLHKHMPRVQPKQ